MRRGAIVIKTNIFDLSGKVALVTAGGHGLGRAYCEAMAEFGADVACTDISLDRAQETVDLIKRFGHRTLAMEVDVSNLGQVEIMVKQTVDEFGTIDILFCNAGIGNPPGKLHEVPIEDWNKVLAVNLTGTFFCMRSVLPIMVQQKRGSIISTTSTAGLVAGAMPTAPYGATKAAIIGLTKHAAVAYAKDGIRINAIAPGGHETWPLGFPREEIEKINKKMSEFIPMGRMGHPSEIKGLAVYLASDASSYVTGQTFVEDGGYTA